MIFRKKKTKSLYILNKFFMECFRQKSCSQMPGARKPPFYFSISTPHSKKNSSFFFFEKSVVYLDSLQRPPTSFAFLSSCVQPFIHFSHHLTIRLFAISTLSFPQGRFYPSFSFFFRGPHSPTGLLSYSDIGQSTRWKI